ncbi:MULTISPECIES: hypothetical protein [Arthrobacter]|uniref:Uncharacterized protein n=2 Tax=Arthrobacter TaxID=1663 RepID=A0ABU9KND7_9MICC|nr:hypothetical protein [Arthrobacter sp. YJM1]MDP5228377.1 hypothetical protein [Arthrobacter sp. YJM1]
MRVKSAIAVFVLGLLALFVGIGQRTFWAPPETVSVTVPASVQDAPLTVVAPSFAGFGGKAVTVDVKGEGTFTVATGRPDDVDAWVGKTAHNTVQGLNADKTALDVQHSDGDATSPNPAEADLWATTQAGNGDLSFKWNAPASGDWSLLIASDGSKPAPKQIEFTFANQATSPWSIPLIVLGGLLMLGALLFIFLFGKGGTGGKTAVAGPSTGAPESSHEASDGEASDDGGKPSAFLRRPATAGVTALVLGVSALGGLAGVAPAHADSTPSPSSSDSASASDSAPATGDAQSGVPVLTAPQLARILNRTADAITSADAARNAKDLGSRASGDALTIRTQNYKIQAAVKDAAAVAPVSSDNVLAHAVTNDRSWPRTVLAVTQGAKNPTPVILTLQQASARENYKLVTSAYLLPTQTFPVMGKDSAPTQAESDANGLTVSPDDAFKSLTARLKDAKSADGAKFADGSFFQETESFKTDLLAAKDNKAGLVPQFDVQLIGQPKVTFKAADGSALSVADLKFTVVIPQKNSGDIVTLDPRIAALTGEQKSEKKVTQTFIVSAVVRIPRAGSADKLTLIGADRYLTAASLG